VLARAPFYHDKRIVAFAMPAGPHNRRAAKSRDGNGSSSPVRRGFSIRLKYIQELAKSLRQEQRLPHLARAGLVP
jgi:hypothetical protein